MRKSTGNKMTKVTPLEMAILLEVQSFDLNDGTQECFYGPIYHSNFDMKVIRGVISSLVKKGIVSDVEEISNSTELVISNDYTGVDSEGCFELKNVWVV